MSTVASPAARPPAVLYDIDWQTYTRLLRVFERSGRKLRLTYDRGTLEIMSPQWQHERPADLLACFVVVLTEELDLPRVAGRSVTLRRRKKQRGLEPDNCYWIANAPLVQGKRVLNLRVDPPPDLAIEVDVTSSVMNRIGIYADLGVPELWRLSTGGIAFHILASGQYQIQSNSQAFPQLASADLVPFLAQWGQTDDNTIVRQFRGWVKQHLLSKRDRNTSRKRKRR